MAASAISPRVARADEFQDFENARRAYEAQNYRNAAERFEGLVGGPSPRLTNEVLILESRKFLAASYLFVGRPSDAEGQFELLLRQDAGYQLDPLAFPNDVVALFGSVRQRLDEEREASEEHRIQVEQDRRRREAARLLRERERSDRLLQLAREEVVLRENSRWIALLPFGAGQFQNGDQGLGWTMAVSQGLLAATSLGTAGYHVWLRDQVGVADSQDIADRDGITVALNLIATIAWAAVTVGAIVDAQLRFVPEVRTTRLRDLPAELTAAEDDGSGSVQTDGEPGDEAGGDSGLGNLDQRPGDGADDPSDGPSSTLGSGPQRWWAGPTGFGFAF